ncbi:MAG: PEP-utilizing enzyme [Nesterenkonia sp.]|uniref:putative PEP-binding protein n=1 Tax=Nesterenkonia marinintestina TaxID=2979865 RepID=UPI0021C15CBF|nr:putative PEP-binding protein [Nesterenkonia sp. GX14115]MDO5492813.1 PEP-utilizing enzyme [Nesterenkonia sp.]
MSTTELKAEYSGVGVCPGRVVGPVLSMPDPVSPPGEARRDASVGEEQAVEAVTRATAAVAASLKARAAEAEGDAAGVLEATAMMATDSMLLKAAKRRIADGATSERAFWDAAEEVTGMFAKLGGKMAERQRDVRDVRDRVVAELRGVTPPGIPHSDRPFVLLAEDLAPADTATLDPAKVVALVTSEGGPQSHTAIIARSLSLPAVVAARGVLEVPDGTEVHVDGGAGAVHTQVTEELRAEVEAFAARRATIQAFDGDGRLADGTAVPLRANVGNGADARAAAEQLAQGVGLFRTEFLFFDRDSEPGHDEQVAAYREVFEAFSGREEPAGDAEEQAGGEGSAAPKVVLRTLDAGADKPLPFLTDAEEPNPALGVRGFRTERSVPGVLARQLAAVAEAAAAVPDVEVWVMAPMIATADEAAEFRRLTEEAGLETPGVMVEVPAAALCADRITAEVDFVSIGTNDLTQYTMASDRMLGSLAELNDAWQPAVLNLVGATGQGSSGPVGVCGEAAGDPVLAPVLIGLGVTSLSMSPASLADVAAVLRTLTAEQTRELAAVATAARGSDEARAAVAERIPALTELGLG